MSQMNRIHNSTNPYQGPYKRVLCVCSAGLLRSPTAALVLSQPPFNYNTRAAGAEESYALVPVDEVLISWAQEVVCMTAAHAHAITDKFGELKVPLRVLDISDDFAYRDPDLIEFIKARYSDILESEKI